IDKEKCLYLNHGICALCAKNCGAEAIDFTQKDEILEYSIASIFDYLLSLFRATVFVVHSKNHVG
ncbi:unnamed protein product, partial [marine sediment metagenome]